MVAAHHPRSSGGTVAAAQSSHPAVPNGEGTGRQSASSGIEKPVAVFVARQPTSHCGYRKSPSMEGTLSESGFRLLALRRSMRDGTVSTARRPRDHALRRKRTRAHGERRARRGRAYMGNFDARARASERSLSCLFRCITHTHHPRVHVSILTVCIKSCIAQTS